MYAAHVQSMKSFYCLDMFADRRSEERAGRCGADNADGDAGWKGSCGIRPYRSALLTDMTPFGRGVTVESMTYGESLAKFTSRPVL